MNNLLFILLILSSTLASSQDDVPFVKTDSIFKITPYIDVENGMTIKIQCKILENKCLEIEKITEGKILDSTRTITISYQENTLKIKNPFDQALGYDAYLYSPSMDKYYLQKTYPVHPKIGSIEMYPGSSKFFRLCNFHLGEYSSISQEKQIQQDMMRNYNKLMKKKKKK